LGDESVVGCEKKNGMESPMEAFLWRVGYDCVR